VSSGRLNPSLESKRAVVNTRKSKTIEPIILPKSNRRNRIERYFTVQQCKDLELMASLAEGVANHARKIALEARAIMDDIARFE
jgi:hypothetical protein